MICLNCGTELEVKIIDYPTGRILLENVKCHVCPNCGEIVFDNEEAKEIERRISSY